MLVEAQVAIDGPKEAVWSVISDIENAAERISAIESIEILNRPDAGLIGLKWRETRTMFGKTATEEMWITEAVENQFYKTGAESHGFAYVSTMSVSAQDGGTCLTMTHESKPQGLLAKVLAIPMGFVFKGMMRKCILQDLNDVKAAVENPADTPAA